MKKFEVEPIGKINVSKEGMVVELEQKYVPALKALEGFSHLNIIWWFSEFDNKEARSVLEAPNRIKNLLS
jgi:tRNA (adenine37-N6)-methyltransferase